MVDPDAYYKNNTIRMDNELMCHSMSFRRQHFQIYTLSSVQLKNAAASEWPNPCFTLKREYFTGLVIFRPVAPLYLSHAGLVKRLVLFAF